MVSPSKKKRKVTTVEMKAVLATKQSTVLVPVTTTTSPNRPKRRKTSLSPALKSKTASISHPSSSKIHPPLSNTSFFSSIRTYSKDGTDMLADLSKNILNDFELKYEMKNYKIVERRSVRLVNVQDDSVIESINDSNNAHLQNKHSILLPYRRCLVEDFMVLQKNTNVLLLIPLKPQCELLQQDSFWSLVDINSITNYQSIIQIKKMKYHCISGCIITNPKLDSVLSGISQFDLMDGLGTKNSGCLINLGNDNDGDPIYKLITWNMVLKGGITGIQVWSERKDFRNLATAFNNRKKTNIGLISLLNVMYYEMYGDRTQCMYLISCFYRTQLKQKQLEYKNNTPTKEFNDDKEEVLFEGKKYNDLICDVDLIFKKAIISTYQSFCVLGEPLVSSSQINILLDRFKIEMKVHYFMMKKLLGIDKKERLTKNKHLVSTGYYDRMIFYNFLTLSRLRNPQNCIHYAMISAAALYSKGCGDNVQKRFTYSGTSSTVQTFLRHVRPYGDNMLQSAATALYNSNFTVATLDNNQKGNPLKFQRYGSSNTFVKVTARYFRDFIPYSSDINTNGMHASITYVKQAVPSPNPMIPFEMICNNEAMDYSILSNAVVNKMIMRNDTQSTVDFSGKRVKGYANIIDICDEVQFGLRSFMTGCNRTDRTYEYWQHMPEQHKTKERDNIVQVMNRLKSTAIASYSSFQNDITIGWNPSSKMATKLLIPPVSLRDEIKTDGFGMAVIELLCLVGILHEEQVSDTYIKWELDRNWKQRKMILCVDGLSLDRHRHFQKKMSNVKLSFSTAFKQSLIFQKALSRVVEINGPLHMAFHMLQTIFTVFGTMLKWGQTIVDWKRLTSAKVCDSFDLCRQLTFLMLEELDRLAWDMYLLERKDEIESTKTSCNNDEEFLCKLAHDYLIYLKDKASTTCDERRKYVYYFMLMCRKFRQFWYSMRRGDRVMLEYITIEWCGIFYLLKKHNYFEICLSAIEKEYSNISYDELQAIRINSAVRYRNGNDNKGNPYPLHVLDEVMENINAWTKRLLLGPDEVSWRIHSPNLMCAHRSNNFESDAFTKQHIEWNINDEPTRKDYTSSSTRTTEPRKTVERRRIYEWSVIMFNDEQQRCINEKDGFNCINRITTPLQRPTANPNTIDKIDHLEDCIDQIFETTNLNDNINPEPIDDEAIEDNTEANNESNRGSINSLALLDVFDHGNNELNKIDVTKIRLNKKKRTQRHDDFYREIYANILDNNDDIDTDCNDVVDDTVVCIPWFRTTYDLLLFNRFDI